MKPRITIVHHGHCFDGMASAAVLGRFFVERGYPGAELTFRGLDHQPGGSHVPDTALDSEINAVVDFRYTTSPALTWYFDHHVSGIVGPEEERHFASDESGRKFFDPAYGSCCKLIAEVLRERFDFEPTDLSELIRWADVIDAARFPDADAAVDLSPPAMKLMTVLEVHGDDRFLTPRIRKLLEGVPLDEVAGDPEIGKLLEPLEARHHRSLEAIRRTAQFDGGVVTFDLAEEGSGDRYNKFIPYWLFPESRYCVGVSVGPARAKVSVGSNPWASIPRTHDIAALCARYGGGGHPVVGAVSLRASEIERAREIAREIAAALREG